MSASVPWQAAFAATTVVLGGSVDDALASLEQEGAVAARDMLSLLRHEDRTVRARALASVLALIAADVDERRVL